jgi:DNA excision repair protein ERCC-4
VAVKDKSPYKAPFVIAVDTREQRPLDFPGFAVMRKTLPTGDYSMQGFEDRIAIERKSKTDAWGCVADGRARFERCLGRLGQLERAAVVIECSLSEFQVPPARVERVNAAMAVGSYLSWMVQFRVPVIWCDNREFAARVVVRLLASFYKHLRGENNGG